MELTTILDMNGKKYYGIYQNIINFIMVYYQNIPAANDTRIMLFITIIIGLSK